MPTCTHTQVMMVLAVWQIAGPCTFDLLPCPVCSIASPKGFILTSHLRAASSCCRFGYPAYLFLSKDLPCSPPWGYSVLTAIAHRALSWAKPWLRIKYLIIFSDWKCELSIGGEKQSFKALCWDIEPLALSILHIVDLKAKSFPMCSKGILDNFWITLCWLNVTFPSELCAVQLNLTKVWEVQTSQNGPQNVFKSFQALPK